MTLNVSSLCGMDIYFSLDTLPLLSCRVGGSIHAAWAAVADLQKSGEWTDKVSGKSGAKDATRLNLDCPFPPPHSPPGTFCTRIMRIEV